mmetsp:Transcript_20466/g.30740  ORF Transcript_20466/g.30740 Transcript_20466/m.30740 type:complete len:629 (+) Transcript_20466:46-1932(+)
MIQSLNEATNSPTDYTMRTSPRALTMREILFKNCSSPECSYDTPVACSADKAIIDKPMRSDDVNILIRADDDTAQFDIEPITPCSLDFNDGHQADTEERDDHHRVYTYPSGRLPLVPISGNHTISKTLQTDKKASEKEHVQHGKKRKESMSWISKTFCGLPSKSTLDNVGDLSNDEIPMNCSFDDSVRFVSDEGSVLLDVELEDELEDELVDEIHDNNANFYPYLGATNTLTPQLKVSRGRSIFRDRTPATPDTFDNLLQNALSCNTWQNWYDDEVCDRRKVSKCISNRRISKLPHNSSINPAEKKKRIYHLRKNISPFGIAEIEETNLSPSKRYKPIKMKKKMISFPNKIHYPKKASTNSRSTKIKPKNEYQWSSSIIATCGNFSSTQEIEIVPDFNFCDDKNKVALCYDSDPGEFVPTTKTQHHKNRSKPTESRKMNDSRLEFDENDLIDEEMCEDIVFEQLTTRRLMVWHQEANQNSCEPPVAIHAWIETGTQLNTTLIQPKFCWQEAYTRKPDKKSVLQNALTFHAVDLLDISKIIPVDGIVTRDRYPFVKRNSCFLIEAFGGSHSMVFEARDETERQDIIDGLKLVVSRLGSKIIVGDGTVLNEFFTPFGAQVPGDIPLVLQP